MANFITFGQRAGSRRRMALGVTVFAVAVVALARVLVVGAVVLL